MQKVLTVNKPIGMTPLQMIEMVRWQHLELREEKMAYAGRLDPMAEGLLLILIGEECLNRTMYERMDKEYEFEILLGIETDTYDTLGLVEKSDPDISRSIDKKVDDTFISQFTGTFFQQYPPYSSARVNGKALYWYAREGKLDTIEIPGKEVTVISLEKKSSTILTSFVLQQIVYQRITKVTGEFRQTQILHRWLEYFEKYQEIEYPVISFKVICSSGTYVRSICHEMGKKLGTSALAYSIKRTRVGEFILP